MKQIGSYRVLREVARGGMGVVYRGVDDQGVPVAIKLLHDAEDDARFEREARALGRLAHPGIVGFRELLRDGAGGPALVMDWVEGEALSACLKRRGPLPVDEVVRLGIALCEALEHAHAQGVLHRDLKPHNVMLTPGGELKLTDFGLGKLHGPARRASMASLTAEGEVLGTPAYLPPEQATGDKRALGPAADVYGAGATLYALLTGCAPFAGPTAFNILNAVLTHDVVAVVAHRPEVPPALDALIVRCLAKDPADRPSGPDALRRGLEALAGPQAGPRAGRALAAAAVLAVGAGLVAAWVARAPVEPRAAVEPGAERPGGADAVAQPAPAQPVAEPAPPTRGELVELTQTERWDALRAAATRALAVDPDRGDARHALAVGLYNTGDPDGARRAAHHATLIHSPDLFRAHRFLAELEDRRGDKQAAQAAYGVAYLVAPPTERARMTPPPALETSFRRLHELSEVLRIQPGSRSTRLARARLYRRLGHFHGALADYTAVTETEPENARAWSARAEMLVRLERDEAACEAYERAIRLAPDAPEGVLRRGFLLLLLGRVDEARVDLQAALRLGAATTAYETFTLLHALAGDAGGVLRTFDELGALVTGDSRPLVELSRAVQAGDVDPAALRAVGAGTLRQLLRPWQAADAFSTAVEAAPAHPSPWVLRGRLRLRLALPTALADLSRAIELAEGLGLTDLLAETLVTRGSLLGAQGRLDDAAADLQRALALGLQGERPRVTQWLTERNYPLEPTPR